MIQKIPLKKIRAILKRTMLLILPDEFSNLQKIIPGSRMELTWMLHDALIETFMPVEGVEQFC